MNITENLTAVMLGILTLAALLTAPFALLLVGLYRRAVIRLMRKRIQSVPAKLETPEESKLHSSPFITKPEFVSLDEISSVKNEATMDLYGNLRKRHWQAAAVYVLGGLSFTTLLTIAFLVEKNIEVSAFRFLYTGLICFWPTVLVVNWVAPLERRSSYLIFTAYFSAWLAITAIMISRSPALTWSQCILLWLVINSSPTIIVMMFLYRRIRAVGPLVFTFLVFGLSGVLLEYRGGAIVTQSVFTGMTCIRTLFTAALGGLILQLLKWLYLHKRQSDQSLLIDPIWLVFGFLVSGLTARESPWWILAGPIAFVCYKIVTWTGFYFLNRKRGKLKGPELLLLRVFSLGKRSEQLYSAIAKTWRYVGNIHFIIGPDLVTSTVEPHGFLDYISGGLHRHFIDSAETLAQRINNSDEFPDLDGRYRIHDFFCYDDTWKMVLSCLAKDCDAILMDLRKFSRTNAGCVFEIKELVNTVPLQRIVFVVDKTTDEAFLHESMENTWKMLSPSSPNREKGTEIRLFHYNENRAGGFHQLLFAVSAAATSGD